MLLALDINSRRVGWAIGGPADPRPRLSAWSLYGCQTEDDLARSCAALYRSISDLSKFIKPRFVYYEAPFNPQGAERQSNAHTVRGLLSLAAVAMAAGVNAGAITKPVHVATWRKHFCGQGRPENPKRATMDRCRLLGWDVKNDDEADAAGVWAFAMAMEYPQWAPNSTPLFRAGAA